LLPWRCPWRRLVVHVVTVVSVVAVLKILVKASPLPQLLSATMYLVGSDLVGSEPFISEERSNVVKGDFKSVEDAEVVPGWGDQVVEVGGRDSLKPIVIDKVVLWRDVAGTEVPN
jgi:hypothetical protein